MKYILSEQAEAALADIYGYSAYSHGEIQAEEYIEALYQTFERLSKWNQIGKDASEYLQGLKQYRCNKHYIFYTVEKPI